MDICHVTAISVDRNSRQICKRYRSNQAVLRAKHALTDGGWHQNSMLAGQAQGRAGQTLSQGTRRDLDRPKFKFGKIGREFY